MDKRFCYLYPTYDISNNDIAICLNVSINMVKLYLSKFRKGGVQRVVRGST